MPAPDVPSRNTPLPRISRQIPCVWIAAPPPSQPRALPAPHYLQLRCLLLSAALSLPSPSSLSIPTPLISGRQPNVLLYPESAGAPWKAAPRPHAPVNMCVCPCLQLLSPGGCCLHSHRERPLVPKGFLGPSLLKNHWTGQAGGKESLLSFRCQQLVGEGRCPSKGPLPCPQPPAGQELLETEVGGGGRGCGGYMQKRAVSSDSHRSTGNWWSEQRHLGGFKYS